MQEKKIKLNGKTELNLNEQSENREETINETKSAQIRLEEEIRNKSFVFWGTDNKIVPHLLYEFFTGIGIGKYFTDNHKWKNSDSIIVKVKNNVVSEVNCGYLLETANLYIKDYTKKNAGNCGLILDSFHKNTALFGEKNLKLLQTLKLEFITDSKDAGYFFFQNGIVIVMKDKIHIKRYEDFDRHVWEKSIVPIDFNPLDTNILEKNCDFLKFLKDLTVLEEDIEKSSNRLKALMSAVGYQLHRYKDPATTKALILMDVYKDGTPNGGSGKTLLIIAIGKIRNLSIIDGKKYDPKEWFAFSSVEPNTEILLLDDVERNFNFEQIFPLMTTGFLVRRKYKNNEFVPFEKSPKIAITTNYAINGNSDSFKRRLYEFEVSATYSAGYSPRDKFGKNFFDEWNNSEWNLFFNTMFSCVQVFLNDGLLYSEPINMQYTKLINKTSEDFAEWATDRLVYITSN